MLEWAVEHQIILGYIYFAVLAALFIWTSYQMHTQAGFDYTDFGDTLFVSVLILGWPVLALIVLIISPFFVPLRYGYKLVQIPMWLFSMLKEKRHERLHGVKD